MPVPSKSGGLRVASAAPRDRQTAAMSAPKPDIGRPGSLALGGDGRVVFSGCRVDGDDLVFEGPEDIVGGG